MKKIMLVPILFLITFLFFLPKPVYSLTTYEAQTALFELGFISEKPDGVQGRKTRKAIERFQKVYGLPITGGCDKMTAARLESYLSCDAGQPTISKRVALVIGNSSYLDIASLKLKNPVNDAKAIAQKLKALNFQVIERYDLPLSGFDRTLAVSSQ